MCAPCCVPSWESSGLGPEADASALPVALERKTRSKSTGTSLACDAEARESRGERARGLLARREDHARRGGGAGAVLRAAEIDDAARDRGGGVDEAHRPGRKPREPVEQERIVCAGEH